MYKIINKITGEEKFMLPHTAKDEAMSFASAELAGTDEWQTTTDLIDFANPNDEGFLSNEEWDIELVTEEEPELSTEETIDDEDLG